MKISTFFGGAATVLITEFPITQGATVDAIAPRDFSADLRNFGVVQQLLHNVRSRIGIPFTAMRNVGLNFNQTLEVKPLNLVLLPRGYCFSCWTAPHNEPDYVERPEPFHNEMVELDESQLLLIAPMMLQEKVLRTFLLDVSSHGNKIAIPKSRLENAPVFEAEKHICMPGDPEQTTCSSTPSFISTSSAATSSTLKISDAEIFMSSRLRGLHNYLSSIYKHKSLPNTEGAPMASGTSTRTNTITATAVSGSTVTNPEATSFASSTVLSLTKSAEQPRSTSFEEHFPIPPTFSVPASANDGNYREAMLYSMRTKELAELASRSSVSAAAASACVVSVLLPSIAAKDVAWPRRKSLKPEYQPMKTTIAMMQRVEIMRTASSAHVTVLTSINDDCLTEPTSSQ